MSQDEQDAVLGRTVREKADLTKELAAIDAKLHRLAEAFGSFSMEISERTGRSAASTEPTSDDRLLIPAILAECADLSRVAALVEERRVAYQRLRKTLVLLEQMGVR